MRCSLIQHKLDGMLQVQYGNNCRRDLQKLCGTCPRAEKVSGVITADTRPKLQNGSCSGSSPLGLSKKSESQLTCASFCLDAVTASSDAENSAEPFDTCYPHCFPSNHDDIQLNKIKMFPALVSTSTQTPAVTLPKSTSSAHENISKTTAFCDPKLPNFSVPLVPTKSRVRAI
jgi:hypothetical protein